MMMMKVTMRIYNHFHCFHGVDTDYDVDDVDDDDDVDNFNMADDDGDFQPYSFFS